MSAQRSASPVELGWSDQGNGKRPEELRSPDEWVTMREAARISGLPLMLIQGDVRHRRVPVRREPAESKGVAPNYRVLVRVPDLMGLRRLGKWQQERDRKPVRLHERFLELHTAGQGEILVNTRYIRKVRRLDDGTAQIFEVGGDMTTVTDQYDQIVRLIAPADDTKPSRHS